MSKEVVKYLLKETITVSTMLTYDIKDRHSNDEMLRLYADRLAQLLGSVSNELEE